MAKVHRMAAGGRDGERPNVGVERRAEKEPGRRSVHECLCGGIWDLLRSCCNALFIHHVQVHQAIRVRLHRWMGGWVEG
eukprot:364354-Chlamydomonas_euryale.AAC.1